VPGLHKKQTGTISDQQVHFLEDYKMVTKITRLEEQLEAREWQLSPLPDTVELMRSNALNAARARLSYREQEADLATLLQRRDFADYLRHTLAQEVAQVIAAYDRRVLTVYAFEESANPDAQTEDYSPAIDPTIHLLVLVTSASAALEAFITSLDRALTDSLRELPSVTFSRRLSFLDVIPVTQRDVEEGRGYAVLLNSFYARPLKIWQRG
jgi:hypothetical protein